MLRLREIDNAEGRLAAMALRDLVKRPEQFEADEDAAGFTQLGFDILKTTLSQFWVGDIRYTRLTSQIGVRLPNKPNLDYNTVTRSRLIIDHRSRTFARIESVRVKFRARIQYNGPEVVVSFGFDAGGKRARLGRDVEVTVRNPLAPKTVRAGADWRAIGIQRYPVIQIPIEFRVDHPWPTPNRDMTFTLVLSGMHGFGAPGLKAIIDRREVST